MIRFLKGIPECVSPIPASETLNGAALHRAALFCQPFIAANSNGWLVSTPFDIDLRMRGQSVYWRPGAGTEWALLDANIDILGFSYLSSAAPELCKKYCAIPLCAVGPEPGIVQIWTGLFVRTSIGVCSLVRPLVNRQADPAFEVLEGIIDSDWWLGPLIVPIRLCRNDELVSIRKSKHILQLQLVDRSLLGQAGYASTTSLVDPELWTPDDWAVFHSSMELREPGNKIGAYRAASRKFQKQYGNEKAS